MFVWSAKMDARRQSGKIVRFVCCISTAEVEIDILSAAVCLQDPRLILETVVYLDQLPLIEQVVGYGDLGTNGALGYDGRIVGVGRQQYVHALSAHAPSRLVFNCGRQFQEFYCKVALNDDIATKVSSSDFAVYADGRVVAAATQVQAGDAPR